MIAPANDQRGIGFGQRSERRVRIGRAGMIDQHHSDVFARNASDRFAAALHKQLFLPHGQMRCFAGNLDGAFNHGVWSCLRSRTRKSSDHLDYG